VTSSQGPVPDTETAAARRNEPGEGYVVGLSGGSASGKSTLAAELAKRLEAFRPVVLNQDRYFHDWSELPPEEREARMTANHPDAVRWPPLVEHVARLRNGEAVDSLVPGTRSARQGPGQIVLGPTRLLIVEGHLIFGEPALRALFDLKLFLDVPPDERILRRMYREAVERGGDLARAIAWYRRDVLPNYRLHTEPTRQFADLILPWTEAREAIIDLIAAGVRARLEEGLNHRDTEGTEEAGRTGKEEKRA
jgi:uridine kinase